MHIEVRHARIVVALAEAGSISKAAAKLDLPQPSVSVQLRRIEKALGGELFVRSSTGVIPTPFGERMIPMLVDLTSHAEAVVAEAASFATRSLKIGIAEWPHVSLTMAIQGAQPHQKIHTVTMGPVEGLEAVGSGALAAALVPTVEALHPPIALETGLASEVLVREPIYLALPDGHPCVDRRVLSASQLVGMSWVRHVPGHRFHSVEEHLFGAIGGGPEVLHEVGGQTEAMNWVRDAGAVALATPTGPIHGVSLVEVLETPRSRVDLVWRPGSMEPDVVRSVLSALRSHFRFLSGRVPRYVSWLKDNVDAYPELVDLLP